MATIFGAVQADAKRRALEHALRCQQAQLKATFDLVTVGIVQLSLDGRPLLVNQRLCDMLGYSHEQQLALSEANLAVPGSGMSHPYTVLYAEDNPMNVELVRQVMKMRPACRLLVAINRAQALEQAKQERPDLLLVDMHLGDMSGVDLARLLDRDPALSRVPRIVLLADATPDQFNAAMSAGFAAYLTKPIHVAELLRSLDGFQARKASGN